MATPTPATDGLLLVDKPAGVSSHDVVNVARRAIGEKRMGHGGTLDPFATGLLVLCAGRATRLLQYLPAEPKVYEATIAFGAETDTEDLHGVPIREAPRPTRAALLAALPTLTGSFDQVPPAYSAKRVGGRRAYELAREGAEVELRSAPITVHRWDILAERGPADAVTAWDVRITCAGGTYVRSLARDLARAVGSAAHLSALRRVRVGAFDVRDAVSLADLREGRATLRPALDALPGFPMQSLTEDELLKIVRGIDIAAQTPGPWAALVRDDRPVLVALAERREDRWQPRVVMREA